MARSFVALVAVVLLAAAPAFAGIVDTPLPAGTKLLYSVPGVMNTATGFGTFFMCTNTDKVATTIGVQVFGPTGGVPLNNFATTAALAQPGGTVLIGTRDAAAAGFVLDQNLGLATTLGRGSARIVGPSTKFICTVFVVDAVSFSTSWPLTIVAKTKQKAAN